MELRQCRRPYNMVSSLAFAFAIIPAVSGQQPSSTTITPSSSQSASTSSPLSSSASLPKTLSTSLSSLVSLVSGNHSLSSTSTNTHATTSAPPSSNTDSPFSNPNPAGGNGDPDSEQEVKEQNTVNWYLAFLALVVIALALAVWLAHRRKRKLKTMSANARSDALARDMAGWVQPRRWLPGNGRSHNNAWIRREEGLNEVGEAPPAYNRNEELNSRGTTIAETQNHTVAIPLNALSREDVGVKPPDYQESIRRPLSSPSSIHPSTLDTLRPSSDHVRNVDERSIEDSSEQSPGRFA